MSVVFLRMVLNLMIREFQRRIPIKAERFDGSDEMMKKYDITCDGGDTYTFRKDHQCLPLVVGDWIVDMGILEVLGITLHEWQTMSNVKFNSIYKMVD